jgi:hypothetical protein
VAVHAGAAIADAELALGADHAEYLSARDAFMAAEAARARGDFGLAYAGYESALDVID